MTASEWDRVKWFSQHMVNTLGDLRFPRSPRGRRKLRLYACGCCRRTWDILPHDALRKAVEVAERFADGEVDKAKLQAAEKRVRPMNQDGYFPRQGIRKDTAVSMAVGACGESAYNAALTMTGLVPTPIAKMNPQGERMLCDLPRCVFGNPFRPPAFEKVWRTETVSALAKGIYADHAFDRLPILADALEEAGCDNADVLTHCRDPKLPHCRGCWVVDLALGK
jgi:hypothetical protein